MLAHIANKIKEKVVLHPVIVVAYLCSIDGIVKIKESAKLLAYALHIVLYFLHREELALLGLERGIANHTRGATDNCQGLMTGHLEVFEKHNRHKMTDMQRVSSGIYTHVCCGHFLGELLLGARHDIMYHSAPT